MVRTKMASRLSLVLALATLVAFTPLATSKGQTYTRSQLFLPKQRAVFTLNRSSVAHIACPYSESEDDRLALNGLILYLKALLDMDAEPSPPPSTEERAAEVAAYINAYGVSQFSPEMTQVVIDVCLQAMALAYSLYDDTQNPVYLTFANSMQTALNTLWWYQGGVGGY